MKRLKGGGLTVDYMLSYVQESLEFRIICCSSLLASLSEEWETTAAAIWMSHFPNPYTINNLSYQKSFFTFYSLIKFVLFTLNVKLIFPLLSLNVTQNFTLAPLSSDLLIHFIYWKTVALNNGNNIGGRSCWNEDWKWKKFSFSHFVLLCWV